MWQCLVETKLKIKKLIIDSFSRPKLTRVISLRLSYCGSTCSYSFIIQPTLTFYTGYCGLESIVFLTIIHLLEPPLFHNVYSITIFPQIFLLHLLIFGRTKKENYLVDPQDGGRREITLVNMGLLKTIIFVCRKLITLCL